MARLTPMRVFTSILLASAAATAAGGEPFRSGPRHVALIELFSSEGCSSCPPAEKWVGGLKGAPGLWKEFVPVVFHVDYWDYLGWKDDFASPEYSDRQRRHASRWGEEGVYTPCMIVDGNPWRGWRVAALPPETDTHAGVELEAAWDAGASRCTIRRSGMVHSPVRAHAALLGFGARRHVGAGENRGRRLQHDFVVLDHAETDWAGGETETSLSLREPSSHGAGQLGLAVWIERRGIPLQAAGGILDAAAP